LLLALNNTRPPPRLLSALRWWRSRQHGRRKPAGLPHTRGSQNWRGHNQMLRRGPMLLSLSLFLSACATTTVTERVYPPAHLIQDCPEPAMIGDTNGALA